MCNRPLVPPERWGLTSVWWAPHPWHGLRMRCTQCAVMLDPRLWENAVYPVCSGPFIPERWGLYSVQRAPHPKKVTFSQYEASPSLSQGRNLPSVQPVPRLWEMMFTLCVCVTQCATSPSTFLRDYYAMGSSALTRPEKRGLPSVQCAVGPSLIPEWWGLPKVQWGLRPWDMRFR